MVNEDYELLTVRDPEPFKPIKREKIVTEEKLTRKAVELVPIDGEELEREERAKQEREKEQEKAEQRHIEQEKNFVAKQRAFTSKELALRTDEIAKLILKKQRRSEAEFKMKKEVLSSSFKASVESLTRRIRKQKEIITSSYGPIVLQSKKREKPIFDINEELDPEYY